MLEGWRRRRQRRRERMDEWMGLESALRDLTLVTFDDPETVRARVMRIARESGQPPATVAREVYLSILGG